MITGGRFDGAIAGIGTTSGTRVVVGMWDDTPFGPVADVMIEHADGRRLLVAPTDEVGRFIADTYGFDEVVVEPTHLTTTPGGRRFDSESLRVEFTTGRRTAVGLALALVPRRIARARWWCRLVDPLARRLRPGVRVIGTAGHGREERYCGLDEHAITSARVVWHGADLGTLAPVDPPVRFGFGSTPTRPSVVRVTTFVADAPGRASG
ncbi:hypothetical protein [Jatrophihabitans fulvus]